MKNYRMAEFERIRYMVAGYLKGIGIDALLPPDPFAGGIVRMDVIAINRAKNIDCTIQVERGSLKKLIQNWGSNFIVFIEKGSLFRMKAANFYILPREVVDEAVDRVKDYAGRIRVQDIGHLEQYLENWGLIKNFLQL
ncbi:MAG: hypothetical protein FJ117_00880 [Deltaproteobacteria bacterium]|nr:hypothetical protein [Deltaproteobacteria bacterium]